MDEVSVSVSLTTSIPSYSFDREEINLESHQVVWCDIQDKSLAEEETTEIGSRLRKIVDYTRFFNDVNECEDYLEETSKTNTFLICSGEVGKALMTRCDQCISSVEMMKSMVEYLQRSMHEFLSQTRIKYGYLQDLLKYLEKDVEIYLAQEKYPIFSGLTKQDITAQVGQPQPWGLFAESLCYLTYPDNCRQRLVVALQDYYRNRSETLAILKEFEENYTPSQAIHWYTRDTVLCRLLNQALRQQNSELLLLFAFYLRDLSIATIRPFSEDLNCVINIGDIHENLGAFYYEDLQDRYLAIKHYNLSINYCKIALKSRAYDECEEEYLLRMISRNYEQKMEILSDNVEQRKKYGLEAIKFGKLEWKMMMKKLDSCEVSRAAECIHRIGSIEEGISLYDQALVSYKTTLEIYDEYEGLSMTVEATLCGCIALIYLEHIENCDAALKYKLIQHEKQLNIYKTAADTNEGASAFAKGILAISHEELADVYIKLRQYEQACTHLITAKTLYVESNSRKKNKQIQAVEKKLKSIDAL
ncbi:unnamed protein product [Adineta ricciae]|uniref:Uncharacterized protein n=1 Tax=Adineta ricciae TaxID=249248 RepID=A0A814KA13_ADIRI|nr:unnamed protein product [Adineta ricciae]CAF1048599.1 unnamed protein product [Adineta ricciae]